MSHNLDTIIAVATPPGRGGVGIVRISGPQSLYIATKITRKKSVKPRVAIFTDFCDHANQLIDQGLVIYFKAPHSFTGEDVIELQAHGSPQVMDLLIQTAIYFGARIAKPGEFSERAFINNKIDLTQAEAIADLIAANSHKAARMAVRSLQGEFSQKIDSLVETLVQLRTYVEASIDFSDEDIQQTSQQYVLHEMQGFLTAIEKIRKSASQGVLIREGLNIVIIGRPNVGKSTLINTLAGKDLAIVTDIAGTTRDVRREAILLDDIPLHIVDTAGLRDSDDPVEKEGIRRAWEELKQADCIIYMRDMNNFSEQDDLDDQIQQAISPRAMLINVVNKIDNFNNINNLDNDCKRRDFLKLSLKTGVGFALLREKIKNAAGYQPEEGSFMARRRHLEALDSAYQLIYDGFQNWKNHLAFELLAEDLRLAHQFLCAITGEFSSDDLLGKIFSSFCIGK